MLNTVNRTKNPWNRKLLDFWGSHSFHVANIKGLTSWGSSKNLETFRFGDNAQWQCMAMLDIYLSQFFFWKSYTFSYRVTNSCPLKINWHLHRWLAWQGAHQGKSGCSWQHQLPGERWRNAYSLNFFKHVICPQRLHTVMYFHLPSSHHSTNHMWT